MKIKKMVKKFKQAYDEGFVTDLTDYAYCNSDCDNCPAAKACDFLAESKNFVVFQTNYDRDILPHVQDYGQSHERD